MSEAGEALLPRLEEEPLRKDEDMENKENQLEENVATLEELANDDQRAQPSPVSRTGENRVLVVMVPHHLSIVLPDSTQFFHLNCWQHCLRNCGTTPSPWIGSACSLHGSCYAAVFISLLSTQLVSKHLLAGNLHSGAS